MISLGCTGTSGVISLVGIIPVGVKLRMKFLSIRPHAVLSVDLIQPLRTPWSNAAPRLVWSMPACLARIAYLLVLSISPTVTSSVRVLLNFLIRTALAAQTCIFIL